MGKEEEEEREVFYLWGSKGLIGGRKDSFMITSHFFSTFEYNINALDCLHDDVAVEQDLSPSLFSQVTWANGASVEYCLFILDLILTYDVFHLFWNALQKQEEKKKRVIQRAAPVNVEPASGRPQSM